MRATLRAAAVAASLTTLAAPLALASPAAADTASHLHLDATYGSDGSLYLPADLAPFNESVTMNAGGASDGDGGLYLVLYGDDPQLVHLLADGSIDERFAGDGTAALPSSFVILSVAASPHGILVSGTTRPAGQPDYTAVVVRLTRGGARDTRFFDDGVLELVEPGRTNEAFADIGTDGSVVMSVASFEAPTDDTVDSTPVLARFGPDGALDPEFGSGGLLAVSALEGYRVLDVSIDGAGRVLLAAASDHLGLRLEQLTPTGRLDTGWDLDGVVDVETGPADRVGLIQLARWGSSVIVQSRRADTGTTLYRYLASGSLDGSFGGDGSVSLPPEVASGIGVLDSGAIVVRRDTGDNASTVLLDANGAEAGSIDHPGDDDLQPFGGVGPSVWSDGDSVIAATNFVEAPGNEGGAKTVVLRRYTSDLPVPGPRVTTAVGGRGAVTIAWDAPSASADPILSYEVLAARDGSQKAVAFVGSDVRQTTLTGLTDGETVDLVVIPRTRSGWGASSVPVSATPSASAPLPTTASGVADLVVQRKGTSAAVASWSVPADDGHAPMVAYVAATVDKATNEIVSWLPVPAFARSVSITGLQSGHQYATIVAPFTPIGFGALSAADVPSGPSSPPQPALVPWVAAEPVSGGLLVTWGPLAEHGVPTTDVVVLLAHGTTPYAAKVVAPDQDAVVMPGAGTGDVDVYVVARSGDTYGPLHGPTPVHVPSLGGGGNLPTTG